MNCMCFFYLKWYIQLLHVSLHNLQRIKSISYFLYFYINRSFTQSNSFSLLIYLGFVDFIYSEQNVESGKFYKAKGNSFPSDPLL